MFEASLNASPTGEGDQLTPIHVIIMAPSSASSFNGACHIAASSPQLSHAANGSGNIVRASLDGVHSGTGEGVCQISSTGTHDRKIEKHQSNCMLWYFNGV